MGPAEEHFEKRVRPVLVRNCVPCHGAAAQSAGLRLDSRAGALKGGGRGTAIVPGNARDSWLIRAVKHDGLRMPVGGKLKEDEIAALEEWVRTGAVWPEGRGPADAPVVHWAFQPVRADGGQTIDAMLGAAMAKGGLRNTSSACQ